MFKSRVMWHTEYAGIVKKVVEHVLDCCVLLIYFV